MDSFFIKRIWQGKEDEKMHKQFVRFSKGEFRKRFALNIWKQPGKIKIGTSFELANDLVDFVFLLTEKVEVSGKLLIKENLEEIKKEINLQSVKTKAKISEAEVSGTLTREQEKIISENAYFMLIDIKANGIEFKTKKKLPKPGKSTDKKVDDKFCVLELDEKFWPQVKNEFLFDCPEGKKFKIYHDININEIIIPRGEKDFDKIRLMAKRKGKIKRIKNVDNKEEISEKDFVA